MHMVHRARYKAHPCIGRYCAVYILFVIQQGRIQDFTKGGSQAKEMVICINYIIYMHIAIIHIIILNEVHCNLLKAIDA